MKIFVGYTRLAIEATKAELPFEVIDRSEEVTLLLPEKTFRILEAAFARIRDGQRALGSTEFRFDFPKGDM